MTNRIIFITPGLAKGGAETQMLKLARFLKLQNMEVLIISLKQINDFPENLKDVGIKVVFLNSNWMVHFVPNVFTLLKCIRTFKPDAVIAFMFIAIVIGRLVKPLFRYRLISSIRASRIDRKWVCIFKLTSKLDNLVVYNSSTSKLNFESTNMMSSTGIVIGNAIKLPDKTVNGACNNHSFRWISIAHFRVDKDYKTLFKAISLIKDRNFKIDIVGHLYDLEWPASMILELGIQNHVNLLDFQAHPSDFLRNSDALILSSFSEGMPNAILEAMAFSKPVLGSDIDSIKEILIHSGCGLLFKTADPADLALKMGEIMDMTKENRVELGNRGKRYIKTNFDEDIILNNWLQVLNPFLMKKDNARISNKS
jgi:glycosyltransferase involved in cell wall biosynthesis